MNNETIQEEKTTIPGLPYTIAKYVVLLAIIAFVAWLVISQQRENVPFETVSAAVEQAIDQESMHNAGTKGFRRFYGLNDADYDGVLMYQSVSGMSADEVLLVKVKSTDQLDALEEAIETRREERMNDFSGYAPEEEAVMEQAEVIVRGKYVLFLPYSQASDVKQAFLTALGE